MCQKVDGGSRRTHTKSWQVCRVWDDAAIQAECPAWQGCDAELAAMAGDLARYYELGGR